MKAIPTTLPIVVFSRALALTAVHILAGPIFTLPLFSQTFQLTVENGYGSTSAAPGDTIHIWAEEWGAARTFGHWSGDTSFLERPDEWHTRIIMPAQNVTVSSNTKVLPTGTANPLMLENIMGRDTLKRVFSYFPAGAAPKGVCWLWHGTNGSASSWAGQEFEQHQFVKYLVGNDWGVIVTESEESTKQQDMTGDGYLRYDYYPDTLNNVDLQNVRAIRDTFIHRGKMHWDTPQASIGFSAGGSFSTLLASIFDWNAAVTHCAPGVAVVIQVTKTPILFSMNARDNHPDVGLAGNLEAYNNYQYLKDKDQCAQFFLLRPSPIYPQRFKRMPGITTALSLSIYNELMTNGCFGLGSNLIKTPGEIEADVVTNPGNWPVVLSLTGPQRQFVLDQLNVVWTSHHFHSDYMGADFKFIESACSPAVSVKMPESDTLLRLSPNPTSQWLSLPENAGQVRVFNLEGKMMLEKSLLGSRELDVSSLPGGLYFLEISDNKANPKIGRFVKN